MRFLERNLEDIIDTTNCEDLDRRGLRITGKRFRQLSLGNYGVCDFLTVKREKTYLGGTYLDFTIYELKKEKIGISAYLQAIRYAKGLQLYLEHRIFVPFNINIRLIGKTVDTEGSFIYMADLFSTNVNFGRPNNNVSNVEYFTYEYSFDGIKFNRVRGAELKHHGFKLKEQWL